MRQRMEEMQKQQEQRFEAMCDSLKLDKEQKKKARKLYDNMQKERRNMFADMRSGNFSREEMREQMTEIQKDYIEKFSALLNEEQKELFKKMQQEMRMRRPGR